MICREATKLFLEKGFEETTREIAMVYNITQGNLSYYYPFKYEILTDLYGRFYFQLLIELEKKYGEKIEGAEITILSDMMINRILLSREKLKQSLGWL
ncbi:MAG: TetR/AcrR family transcriptional regulator [Lachnospiraceae bacterium]|nr:TetR/AcrR family transcriptional regulator [Lachnospiraceae bacterium]